MSTTIQYKSGLDPLIDVLAFFAATRNYGYVDVLGNALDPVTALEAVINALRDFDSTCIAGKPDPEKLGAKCPQVSPEALRSAAELFERLVRSRSGSELVLLTRQLALTAIARAPNLRVPKASHG